MQLKLTFLALVMLSSQALAGTDISVVENSQTTQSQTQSLQQKAGEWGLSPEDYQRYQQLMNGPGDSVPGAGPTRRWGLRPARRQSAVSMRKNGLKRSLPVRKRTGFPAGNQYGMATALSGQTAGETGECCRCCPGYRGRLALFVKSKNCPTCDARLSAVLSDNRPVDIYLVDSEGSDDKLRQWARAHRIPAEKSVPARLR